MDRPDLREVLRQTEATMKQLDQLLGSAQQLSSHTRFTVSLAVELNQHGKSMDQVIKSQIYTEAMGHVFARIIEARTHLDVANRALSEPNKESGG